jgi:hypothetical protein
MLLCWCRRKSIAVLESEAIAAAQGNLRRTICPADGSDDELEYEIEVSLQCPYTQQRIAVAAKGLGCSHAQAFDLSLYIRNAVEVGLWACPVCAKRVTPSEVVLAPDVQEALDGLRDVDDDHCCSAIISRHGWRPVLLDDRRMPSVR